VQSANIYRGCWTIDSASAFVSASCLLPSQTDVIDQDFVIRKHRRDSDRVGWPELSNPSRHRASRASQQFEAGLRCESRPIDLFETFSRHINMLAQRISSGQRDRLTDHRWWLSPTVRFRRGCLARAARYHILWIKPKLFRWHLQSSKVAMLIHQNLISPQQIITAQKVVFFNCVTSSTLGRKLHCSYDIVALSLTYSPAAPPSSLANCPQSS
jgi:hypothetical protein